MYSTDDTPKGWVAPFGHPRIKACSRLPMAFRSVPRPSSPPGAKASTECPSHTQSQTTVIRRQTNQPPITVRKPQSSSQSAENINQTSDRLLSTIHTTPLTTITASSGTILDSTFAPPRSLPVRQITQRRNGRPAPQSKPAPTCQPDRNRAVPRTQGRTRTRFTTQKNKPPGTHPAATRPCQPTPRSRGQNQHHADRGSLPIRQTRHAANATRQTSG